MIEDGDLEDFDLAIDQEPVFDKMVEEWAKSPVETEDFTKYLNKAMSENAFKSNPLFEHLKKEKRVQLSGGRRMHAVLTGIKPT